MPLCKVLKKYPNAEGWQKGDIVDITDPSTLIRQGLVKRVKDEIEEEKEELEVEGFECDVCGFVAKTKGGLAAHKRSH